GIEEQGLFLQQPALVLVHHVLGDKGDQTVEGGARGRQRALGLPGQLVADHPLLGIQQGFADNEIGIVHGVERGEWALFFQKPRLSSKSSTWPWLATTSLPVGLICGPFSKPL